MKYKVCPTCGTHNDPSDYECVKCGIDIINVDLTDEETEKANKESSSNKDTSVMVRICENCNHPNPLNVGECQECGEDLTGITPQHLEKKAEQTFPIQAMLISLDEQFAYELQDSDTTVGRKATMAEYFQGKKYVSRKHAIFTISEGKLFITHISETNPTFVNGQPITSERTELHDGDVIGLGGDKFEDKQKDLAAFFIVRICTCT